MTPAAVGPAHWQFLGLMLGILGWIFTMATAGINEWRLWYVADVSVVTSGVAWVGIWRTCFYSHVLPDTENCWSISVSDSFLPAEIPAAQVLMMLALISGLLGNISAAVAMRMAYFSVDDRRHMRTAFVLSGLLYLLTAAMSLVPLVWNTSSVLRNSTIDFPAEFHLPDAPVRQKVGSAIGVGFLASVLMLLSGLLFLCHRQDPAQAKEQLGGPWSQTAPENMPEAPEGGSQGVDNCAFHGEDVA